MHCGTSVSELCSGWWHIGSIYQQLHVCNVYTTKKKVHAAAIGRLKALEPGTRGPGTRGPGTRGPGIRGPKYWGLFLTPAVTYSEDTTIQPISAKLCYQPKLSVMSCSSSLKALLLTNNGQRYFKLSSDIFDPQSSLLSVLQSQTSQTQSARCAIYLLRRLCTWPLTLELMRIWLVMQRHASSLACNKGDYSWFLQSEIRIQEASAYCMWNSTIWHEECLLCIQQCRLYNDTAT